MKNKKFFIFGLFFSLLFFGGVFLGIAITRTATSSNLNINFSVPAGSAVCGNGIVEGGEECDGLDLNGRTCFNFSFVCGTLSCESDCTLNSSACTNTCGGGGPSADTTPPTITNIFSSSSLTYAKVSWSAVDNNPELPVCVFNYGLDTSYSLNTAVYNNNSNFWIELNGLESAKKYFYQIRCNDASNNYVFATGEFETLVVLPEKSLSLEVYARPDKRVGGNNYSLPALLVFSDNSAHEIFKIVQINLDNSGYYKNLNISLPIYNNFSVFLKGRSHLAKKISGVNITADTSELILNFTDSTILNSWGSYYLYAGDTQGDWPGLKDNIVDVLDLSAEDVKFNQLNDLDTDLNGDGITDISDVSIVLINFNMQGDLLP
ncbi:MAG: hypothetical protein WC414_01370 [Patescibacteria group bacterium]